MFGAATIVCTMLFLMAAASPAAIPEWQEGITGTKEGMLLREDGRDDLSEADRFFVMEAVKESAAEIILARLAVEKSASEDVKRFAERVIADRIQAYRALARLSADKGMAIASQPAGFILNVAQPAEAGAGLEQQVQAKDKQSIARLSLLAGKQFDREYLRFAAKSYKETIEVFRRTAIYGDDLDIKIWAGKTMSVIGDHLQTARELSGRIKRGKAN